MDTHIQNILELLGFSEKDLENCCELKDLLSNIEKDNILSIEEVEILEFAEATGLKDEDINKVLKEHSLDDADEIDELAIEYYQRKLIFLESDSWDSAINSLREEVILLQKTENERKEELDGLNFNSFITDGKEKWKQIWSELQNLFQELKELKTFHETNDNTNGIQEFSSFDGKFNIFTTTVNQLVEKLRYQIPQDNHGKMICNCSELGLTRLHFCNNFENLEDWESQLSYLLSMSNQNEALDFKQWEKYCLDMLSLNKKQVELRLMQCDVHNLDCIKERLEIGVKTSLSLIQILEKARAVLYVLLVLKGLQDEANRDIEDLINDCRNHFQQELGNLTARIASLENSRKKFESFLNDHLSKIDICMQVLEKLPADYFDSRKQTLTNAINTMENKLGRVTSEHNICLEMSERMISTIEEDIKDIREYSYKSTELLNHMSIGFSAAKDVLEEVKEKNKELESWLSENPHERSRRLVWVHFLTNTKKLKELMEQHSVNSTSSLFNNPGPCFTSTPMKEDI